MDNTIQNLRPKEAAKYLGVGLSTVWLYAKQGKLENFAWDLLATRMLGIIMLYKWNDDKSISNTEKIMDYYRSFLNVPCVIAGEIPENSTPIRSELFMDHLSLSLNTKMAFYRENDTESAKNVVCSLLDTLIEQTP